MSKMSKRKKLSDRGQRIMANRIKPAIGTFPGQNRARKFRDRKREANRQACRGKVQAD